MDGLEHETDPGAPLAVDPSDLSEDELTALGITPVPNSLRAAVGEFVADSLYRELMPELMWRAYPQVKLAECDGFEAADEEFEIDRHFYAF